MGNLEVFPETSSLRKPASKLCVTRTGIYHLWWDISIRSADIILIQAKIWWTTRGYLIRKVMQYVLKPKTLRKRTTSFLMQSNCPQAKLSSEIEPSVLVKKLAPKNFLRSDAANILPDYYIYSLSLSIAFLFHSWVVYSFTITTSDCMGFSLGPWAQALG